MKNRWGFNSIWGLLSALLIVGVLALTLWGNSSNLNPRFLFIDEQITFYPIIKLLNPSGLDEFLWLASDGSDYRYGRILWNSLALASAIPEKIFGSAGQILASREIGVILLLVSYVILIKSFIKKPNLQFFCLVNLTVIPYSTYYMSMPKPEPLLLFTASIFLSRIGKLEGLIGRPYWALAGLAIGIKISFLPSALILLAYFFVRADDAVRKKILLLIKSIGYILLGFTLANPYFLQPIFFMSYPILFALLFSGLLGKVFKLALPLAALALGIYLFTLPSNELHEAIKLTGLAHACLEWTHGTFAKVNNSANALQVNFYSWVIYLSKITYPSLPFIGFIFIIFLILYIATIGVAYRKSEKPSDLKESIPLTCLAIVAISMLLLPMISIKDRLWGMYLFPGMVFSTVLFFSMLDYLNTANISKSIRNIIYSLNCTLIPIYIIIFFHNWLPSFFNLIYFLGTRSPSSNKFPLPNALIGI